ncbi:MAG: hypothetical protein ABIE70_08885 [bacterium]
MNKRSVYIKVVLAAVAILSTGLNADAQMADKAALDHISQSNNLGRQAVSNPFSLLDLSRVRWSHSYSVAYFSGGGGSGTVGLFQTNMLYELSSKLSLNVNLGLAHSGNIFNAEDRATSFLPGFSLDYHPSDKFRMSLMVQTYNGIVNPYYGRSSLWHRPLGP